MTGNRWPCAYCHGIRLDGPSTVIHATRFEPGEQTGAQIAYYFCDDGCREAWLAQPVKVRHGN